MDTLSLESLSSCLTVNVTSDAQRKQNEALLAKYKHMPRFVCLLLEIAVNIKKAFASEIELNAAIQLKNFVMSNWKFTTNHTYNKSLVFDDEEEIIIISDEDKLYIKNNIIDAVIYAVNTENAKVLKQLSQTIKKILKFDFESNWKETYFNKIISCFQSGNDKNVYAGIILLHQVSKLYEFETKENIAIYSKELEKVNQFLLVFLNQCANLNDPIQAQFTFKILKIYFKHFQGAVPEFLTNDAVYEKWSLAISKVIQTPLTNENAANKSNKNIFWKLKQIAYQILTRITQKYTIIALDDKDPFANLLFNKYTPIYFNMIKTIYVNTESHSNYINDYCLYCIYNFFCFMINKKAMSEDVIGLFTSNDKMKEQLIKDAMMPSEDISLWLTEPKTYISKEINELGSCLTKRYAAYKLVMNIINYREEVPKSKKKRKELEKTPAKYYNVFINYFVSMMQMLSENIVKENAAIAANNGVFSNVDMIKNNLIKEAIMYLLGNSNEEMEKYSPFIAEQIIENVIIPEIESPIGLMREKACVFISKYKMHQFKNDKLPSIITTKLCALLDKKDEALPVKINSAIAAASMLEQPGTKMLLKGNIKILLSIYLKLIEETDLEEIVESLQNIIKEFKEETTEFIGQLCDYLIKYFNKLVSKESDDDKALDSQSLMTNVISTFIDVIHFFVNNANIYPTLEKHIEVLLKHCLITSIYDFIDDGLDIVVEILKSANKVPKRLWLFYPVIVQTVIGTDKDVEELQKEFPGKIYEGYGIDSLSDICKIVCYFIAKDPETFISGVDENGKPYISYAIKLVENVVALGEASNSYQYVKKVFEILIVMLNVFRGKIDNVHNEVLKLIIKKIGTTDEKYKSSLRTLLSACVIYNPALVIQYYDSINESNRILKFWFDGLDALSHKQETKYNLMGLCCLISVDPSMQNKQVIQNMKHLVDKIIQLIQKVNDKKVKKDTEEEGDEYEEIDDDEEENDDELYKKIMSEDFDKKYDEDLSWDGEDDEEEEQEALIDIDKQSELLFLRDTLNHISQKNPEYYHNITTILGDKVAMLKEIFDKEEQRLKK